jgi:hypothetical protein
MKEQTKNSKFPTVSLSLDFIRYGITRFWNTMQIFSITHNPYAIQINGNGPIFHNNKHLSKYSGCSFLGYL